MAHPTGLAGNVISQPAFSVGDYSMLIEGVVPKSRPPTAPAPSVPSSRSSGGLPFVECTISNSFMNSSDDFFFTNDVFFTSCPSLPVRSLPFCKFADLPGDLFQRCELAGSGSSSKDQEDEIEDDDEAEQADVKKTPASRKAGLAMKKPKGKGEDEEQEPLGFKKKHDDDNDDGGSEKSEGGSKKKRKTKKETKSRTKDSKSRKNDKEKTKKSKQKSSKKRADGTEASASSTDSESESVTQDQLDAAILHASLQEQAYSTDSQAPKWEHGTLSL